MKLTKQLLLSILGLITLSLAGCNSPANPYVEYKPPVLPVKLVIQQSGVSIEGEAEIVTPVGTFSIGAEYTLKHEDDSILVIIRDKKRGTIGFDTIYRIHTGIDEFVAIVNGKTTIQIVNRQILIDVTDGNIQSIEFRKALPSIPETPSSFWQPFPLGYHPFAFTTWAYDDSTISEWYGLGFLWFIIRLVLAFIMLLLDLIVIFFLGIGVILHSIFGITVRNIYFGLLGLFIISFFSLLVISRDA